MKARRMRPVKSWRSQAGDQLGSRPLIGYFPSNGLSDQRFDLFRAHGATYVGEPCDPSKSRGRMLLVSRLRDEIRLETWRDGLASRRSWCLAFGQL